MKRKQIEYFLYAYNYNVFGVWLLLPYIVWGGGGGGGGG